MKSLILFILLSLSCIFISCKKNAGSEKDEVIRIGVMGPYSGANAFIGDQAKKSISFFQSELQNQKTKNKYEFIFEDDQMDVKQAVLAYQKLSNVGKVDSMIGCSSGIAHALKTLLAKDKRVGMFIATDPQAATGVYSFNLATHPEVAVKSFIEWLTKTNKQKVAVFTLIHQWPKSIDDEFKKQIKYSSIKIVAEESFVFGTRDFRGQIAKVADTKPDIILLLAFSPELEILGRQLNEAGLHDLITTMEGFDLCGDLKPFNGCYYIGTIVNKTFQEKYQTVYQDDLQIMGIYYYDMAKLLVDAYERTDGSPEAIADALKEVKDFQGAVGTLNYRGEGYISTKLGVKQVVKEKLIPVEP